MNGLTRAGVRRLGDRRRSDRAEHGDRDRDRFPRRLLRAWIRPSHREPAEGERRAHVRDGCRRGPHESGKPGAVARDLGPPVFPQHPLIGSDYTVISDFAVGGRAGDDRPCPLLAARRRHEARRQRPVTGTTSRRTHGTSGDTVTTSGTSNDSYRWFAPGVVTGPPSGGNTRTATTAKIRAQLRPPTISPTSWTRSPGSRRRRRSAARSRSPIRHARLPLRQRELHQERGADHREQPPRSRSPVSR